MPNTYRHGQFVWRELMSTDVAASLRFYSEVFGWKTEPLSFNGMDYTVVKAGGTGIGGIMKHPVADAPAFWAGSVSVPDVDATASHAAAAGGKVLAGPADAGVMGRYAALQDPQGAIINIWHGNDGDNPVPARPVVGAFCWEQLNTTAPPASLEFYGKLFGWTNKPFGSGGANMKVFESGTTGVASVLQTPPGVPAHWLSYVVVDALAAAYDRVKQQGGKVMVERLEIRTVGTIGVIQDNVGAAIGVFEPSAS